jgi:hypothetical protein
MGGIVWNQGVTMENPTSEEPEDDTAIPLMGDQQLRDFLSDKNRTGDATARGHLIQRAAAEMNRRLFRSQLKSLEAQGRQLEAQGRQNEAQLEIAKSLRKATWWLSWATIVLAIATVALVVVTLFHKGNQGS